MYNQTSIFKGGYAPPVGGDVVDTSNFLTIPKANHLYVNEIGADSKNGILDMKNNRVIHVGAPSQAADAANKTYVDSAISILNLPTFVQPNKNNEFTEDQHFKTQITIQNPPMSGKQAVNKEYLDKRVILLKEELATSPVISAHYLRYLDYKFILDTFKPRFWISSFYFNGLEVRDNTLVSSSEGRYPVLTRDLTEYGIAAQYPTDFPPYYGAFIFNSSYVTSKKKGTSEYIISRWQFEKTYTFIGIAKKKDPASTQGRIFTSHTGNKFFGYWQKFMSCAFHDEMIYGINRDRTPADSLIHMYTLRCANDIRQFYSGTTKLHEGTEGSDSNWGHFVIGDVILEEGGWFEVYEVICFDTKLNDTSLSNIWAVMKKYFNI